MQFEEIGWLLVKYLLEGIAVATAAFYLSSKRASAKETVAIGVTAAVVFLVLDLFAPSIGAASRNGAGFGLGLARVGFGGEGFDNDEPYFEGRKKGKKVVDPSEPEDDEVEDFIANVPQAYSM